MAAVNESLTLPGAQIACRAGRHSGIADPQHTPKGHWGTPEDTGMFTGIIREVGALLSRREAGDTYLRIASRATADWQ